MRSKLTSSIISDKVSGPTRLLGHFSDDNASDTVKTLENTAYS